MSLAESSNVNLFDKLGDNLYNKKKKEDNFLRVKASSAISLLNDLTFIFSERHENGDVVFKLSNNVKFRIHKFVLVARSRWFRRFFEDHLRSNDTIETEDDDLDVKILSKDQGINFSIDYENKEIFDEFGKHLKISDINLIIICF